MEEQQETRRRWQRRRPEGIERRISGTGTVMPMIPRQETGPYVEPPNVPTLQQAQQSVLKEPGVIVGIVILGLAMCALGYIVYKVGMRRRYRGND